jgi:hypothetical protein
VITPAISRDAIVQDILTTLKDPEEYLRGALGRLYECCRERGNAVLRIGITGLGKVPHYRVDVPNGRKFSLIGEGEPAFDYWRAFHGSNHKLLVTEGEEPEILRNEHWSTRVSTCAEVRELLGQHRGFKRKGQINR